MVETRRQFRGASAAKPPMKSSAAVKKTHAASRKPSGNEKGVAMDVDDMEEYYYDDDDASATEDEDEYRPSGSKRKGRMSTGRPTKRVRKSTGISAPDGTHSGPCFLQSMPLDVHFEIFGHVSPSDLLALTLVDHATRKTLVEGHGSTHLWKTARIRHDVPEPSPGMSEISWIQLLYGSSACQVCGKNRGFPKPDFSIRRRVCGPCRRENLVSSAKFTQHFPYYEKTILDLIPFTDSRKYGTRSEYYWHSDVCKIAEQVGKYKSDLSLRKVGARKKWDDFMTERRELVAAIHKHANENQELWDLRREEEKEDQSNERVNERFSAIKIKALGLGYKDVDIDNAKSAIILSRNEKPLTERGWSIIKTSVEEEILVCRRIRLRKDYPTMVALRKQALEQRFAVYMKSLAPSEWLHQQCVDVLCNRSEFKSLVYANEDVNITADSFSPAFVPLASIMREDAQAIRKQLGDILDNATAGYNDPGGDGILGLLRCENHLSGLPGPNQNNKKAGVECLDLAIATFCGHSYGFNQSAYISGDEMFRRYYTCVRSAIDPSFNFIACSTAAKAVRLAGLDPRMATPQDMDSLHSLRFICSCCPKKTVAGGGFGVPVHTWREVVTHGPAYLTTKKEIRLLSGAERVNVQLPAPVLIEESRSWSCNHCTVHFGAWVTFEEAVEHAKSRHSVVDPKAQTDVIVRPDKLYPIPKGGYLVTQQLKPKPKLKQVEQIFVCKQCGTAKKRRFILEGVRSHIRAVHKVSDPRLHVDFGVDPALKKDKN